MVWGEAGSRSCQGAGHGADGTGAEMEGRCRPPQVLDTGPADVSGRDPRGGSLVPGGLSPVTAAQQ